MTDRVATARAEIVVDLDAVAHNIATLRARVAPAALMAVVKADAYGHGMVEVAAVARAAGAEWLGVATPEEAVALREAGDEGRLLSWLTAPGDSYAAVLAADVDVAAYTVCGIDAIAAEAASQGRTARVHLKIDTGLTRGGATARDWPQLCAHAKALEETGAIRVVGVWSHLVASDEPEHPANAEQAERFAHALEVAESAGLTPEVRHIANSAAAVMNPALHHDLVRCGIAVYGLDPAPGVTPDIGLVPAMTVQGRLSLVKEVEPGAGVSYGHAWVAPAATTVGLVPVGYADGIPRAASPGAEAWVAGRRRPVRGKVCMDQLVIDLHGERLEAGTTYVLFGTGADGEPTAQDWAEAVGTINYEIVTGVGGRLARRYVGKGRQ